MVAAWNSAIFGGVSLRPGCHAVLQLRQQRSKLERKVWRDEMGIFGFGRTKIAAEELSRNAVAMMIDADKCWDDACHLRGYQAPGPIATCEIAFARAAITIHLLGQCFPQSFLERLRKAATQYVVECFEDQDTEVSMSWYKEGLAQATLKRISYYLAGAPSHAEMSARLTRAIGVPGIPSEEARFIFDDAEKLLRQTFLKFRPI